MAVRRVAVPWDYIPQEAGTIRPDLGAKSVLLPAAGLLDLAGAAAPTGTIAGRTVGPFGLGFDFDGSATGLAQAIDAPSSGYTIFAVVTTATGSGVRNIASLGDGIAYSAQLRQDNTQLIFYHHSGSDFSVSETGVMAAGTSHVIAATWAASGGEMRLYRNGTLRSSRTGVAALRATTSIRTGHDSFGAPQRWQGQIFLREFYDRVLSAAEIAEHTEQLGWAFEPRAGFFRIASSTAGIVGVSSSSIALTGAADGQVSATGASASTVGLAGTAAASVSIAGGSSATLALTGAATGSAAAAGASASTISLAGSSSAAFAVAGASSGAITLAGSATGVTTNAVTGASSQPIPLTGASAGAVHIGGASAASIALLAASAGQIIVMGASAAAVELSGESAGVVGAPPAAWHSAATLQLLASSAARISVSGASAVEIGLTAPHGLPVSPAWRTVHIAAEDRTLLIKAQDRTMRITQ